MSFLWHFHVNQSHYLNMFNLLNYLVSCYRHQSVTPSLWSNLIGNLEAFVFNCLGEEHLNLLSQQEFPSCKTMRLLSKACVSPQGLKLARLQIISEVWREDAQELIFKICSQSAVTKFVVS